MSMAMFSKSEEAEEDTWSTVIPDKRSQYERTSRCPVWWIRAAAVCLGLLLLVVIFGLVAHNTSALGQRDSLLDRLMKREKLIGNLTEDNRVLRAAHASAISQRDVLQDRVMTCEKMIHNLTMDNKALGDELKQMKINSSRLTEELQRHYNTVATSQDHLHQEVQRLNSSAACKVCESGWMNFDNKCYYASNRGQTKNWEDSRKDCLQRGANLVMPKTRQELNIVAKLNDMTWIGLSDKKQEGKWVWVDGTELQTGFWQTGEPNNARNEDCAEISRPTGEWNDVLCNAKLPWICEV